MMIYPLTRAKKILNEDLFYVRLNKDYDRIKIELILSMIEGVTGSVTCKLYNTFNSNFYV